MKFNMSVLGIGMSLPYKKKYNKSVLFIPPAVNKHRNTQKNKYTHNPHKDLADGHGIMTGLSFVQWRGCGVVSELLSTEFEAIAMPRWSVQCYGQIIIFRYWEAEHAFSVGFPP